MSLRTTLQALAALLLASSANAHMIMANPIPFSASLITNAPITAAQYPCQANVGFTVTTMNNMKVGDTQTLSFKGSAVHGGGSCQLSITTDKTPTANSKFKVIMSMEGGCPGIDGPKDFSFKIPDSIPNGQVTLAWTWFSRLSGAPELYMNCAPVTVTGGASDTSKFDALPDMFVANIASVDCKTPANFNTLFPDPGQNVLTDESAAKNEAPTGSACGKAVSGGGDSASSAAATPTSVAATSAVAVSSAAVATSAAAESSAGNPGGVFAPSASSADASYPTSTLTTLITLTASPSAPSAAVGTSAAAAPTTGGGGGATTTCTTNGAVLCNGPTQFGLCDNGKVVWQAVAAGTTCSNGQITRRSVDVPFKGRIARPRAVRRF
ncbi:lytic polysaccharide monooxygenase [Lepidopterella palustris CBS 459.81]|uniref:Lytic polysaccharide monooxygenase n=1 Tax=Lepidopterella palustris CBS 459.81 TaxID=1314670 RepID=A0A8E2EGP7_9PEZI|nr:lytic polysaccharide monooxygenase [Lepidopterella palustris CBS 459.81]